MSDSSDKIELTPKQKRFCDNYVSKEFFGNGVQSYIDAYDVDLTKPGAYDVAANGAAENLKKPYIYEYINALLEESGLNDSFVDKQLLFLISQHAEFGAKISAIREYNKLKQRIVEKAQVEVRKDLSNLTDEELRVAEKLTGRLLDGKSGAE